MRLIEGQHPASLLFSLAGCSSFQQSSAVQLLQITRGKNRIFYLYDQDVSTGNPQPLFGDTS